MRAPSLGNNRAQVAIVEFGDYECPYCGQHATQTLPELIGKYVETGKVRYFFKDVPIEAIHPHAFKAAEAAQCAGEQGKYWQLHNRLFRHQAALTASDLVTHATAVGLDMAAFRQCLEGGVFVQQIRSDIEEAKKSGVRGTPQFYLGTLDSSGHRVNVRLALRGALPFKEFQRALDSLLD